MGHKRDSRFLNNIRERSEKIYLNTPPLNWGESVGGRHTFVDRYDFKWKKVGGPDRDLIPLDDNLHEYILKFKYQNELAGRSVKVFVGTDSQNHLSFTRFVTVICLQVERNGVHVLVNRMDLPKIYDYKYRLLKEADVSAEFIRNNMAFFKENEIPFEIHCDYNSKTYYKSNLVVTEAMNYFNTLGLRDIKIKSEAVGASYAADHFC
jgi:predicted RNase H-related nuclease YkuK (DUF458 family)